MRSCIPSRGAALVSVLVIAIVFLLLGISIAGVETSQARYATWKYNKALTKQAAAAAIRRVEYQLSTQTNWNAGCIDVSEKKAEGNNCYCQVEVNECTKRYCTVTAHAYLKEKNGSRKWDSRIKVTMKKSCFDFAALGACAGDTGEDPGITVTDNSVVDGDVGSFKPPNTVALKIGSTSSAAAITPAATDNSPANTLNQYDTAVTQPESSNNNSSSSSGNSFSSALNSANQVFVNAISGRRSYDGKTGTNSRMSPGSPGKPTRPPLHCVQPMTGGIGITQTDTQGSQVAPPQSGPSKPDANPSSSSSATSPSSVHQNDTIPVNPVPYTNEPDPSPETPGPGTTPAPEPSNDPVPAPEPTVSCDSSKINGNIFLYKDALVSGNYQNSQLQIVGNNEVISTHYTVPEGRDYQDIAVQAGSKHSFKSGIHTIQNFKADEGSTITIDATRGPVLIYIKESFSLNGARFNVDGDSKNVIIYGAYDSCEKKGCTVSITNCSKASFIFNGKFSQVNVSNSEFSGSLISDKVKITDKSKILFPASLVKMKSLPEILTWEEL